MGFGQGALLVSPLQMALDRRDDCRMRGSEPRPYVVRQVVRDGMPASVSATETSFTNPVSSRHGREGDEHDDRGGRSVEPARRRNCRT